jgi:hypothetical protein
MRLQNRCTEVLSSTSPPQEIAHCGERAGPRRITRCAGPGVMRISPVLRSQSCVWRAPGPGQTNMRMGHSSAVGQLFNSEVLSEFLKGV